MNELQLANKTLDSREVAAMVEKEHNKLLRDIRTYIEYLGEAKIGQSEFFVENTYINSQNKPQPSYKVTKKGCEFIAHKLTGQKGTAFTAKYINRFHEMESNLIRLDSYAITDPIERARAWIMEQQEKQQLAIENKQKDQIISELKPKATYYDLILQNNSLLATSIIAKDYGMSAQALNKILHDLGVQYNLSGTWLLYQKYADKGYTSSKTQNYNKSDGTQGSRLHTYWTQKGRLFIYDLLKQNDIFPLIERGEIA